MAAESPLFQSSMELLAHAVTHYVSGSEQDRKLLILHLANAIELLLKDIVLDSGDSIYKNPKETITIHKALDILKAKDFELPFLNKIELLIDERNALQHRFGSPNELTAIFYMNICTDFFNNILTEHYDQSFDEILDQFGNEADIAAFRMRAPSDDSELNSLRQLANVHPLGALLSATTYLEKLNSEFLQRLDMDDDLRRRPFYSTMLYRFLNSHGIEFDRNLRRRLDMLRRLRNSAAHGRADPTKEEVEEGIDTIEQYEAALHNIDMDEARRKIEESIAQRKQDQQQEEADTDAYSE